MLRELAIRNFAIIEDLSVEFKEGLTVLTGETGAGKSIIINAVNLILGSRASSELIRTSEDVAELEALFKIPPESPAAEAAAELGFDLSEGLLLRRVIHRNGRHKAYINGRLATTQILAGINQHLASIAGQHAHQNLLRPEYQLFILDQFAGLGSLRGEVSGSYYEMLPLIRRLGALKSQVKEQREHKELLQFQSDEIQRAGIVPGEDVELEKERERLKHAERLYETIGLCVDRLYGAEEALVGDLTRLGRELQGLATIDNTLAPYAKRLEAASFDLEDTAHELQDYMQGLVFDSERLETVESRLDALQKLKRKYGGSLEAVLAHGDKVAQELIRVSSLPKEIAETETRLSLLYSQLTDASRDLSEKRKVAAEGLAARVKRELASLGMPKTRFEIKFEGVPMDKDGDPYLVLGDSGIEATGIDRVTFLIAPNVGEDLRPLAQIASGGELSRIVLALRAIVATKESVETLIFDEVDAGIGGGVAEMVGKKLASLARFHQVICITHLAQIAQFGESHYEIAKGVHKGRTRTTMTPLHGEARVKELARMLAGVEITDKAMAHAREMMAGTNADRR